jgi:hypothetical protein
MTGKRKYFYKWGKITEKRRLCKEIKLLNNGMEIIQKVIKSVTDNFCRDNN